MHAYGYSSFCASIVGLYCINMCIKYVLVSRLSYVLLRKKKKCREQGINPYLGPFINISAVRERGLSSANIL